MSFSNLSLPFLLSLTLCFLLQTPALASIKKPYVVYLGSHSHAPESQLTESDLHAVTNAHYEFLATFLGSTEKARDAIFYSYQRHINGFSALLREEEAAQIAKHPKVVSVFLNQRRKLHTTHSWEFMLLERNGHIQHSSIWKKARFGEDTILANIDTGVWPESKSFSDEGYGPIPSRWKGKCQSDKKHGFRCNRKLIGAQYFNQGFISFNKINASADPALTTPRDYEGHGTHTLSTAAGNFVPGANAFGAGNGTAKGGSPKARVATYKVCFPQIGDEVEAGCFDSDIIAAFDAAIHDGVDVISLSVGGTATDYFEDGIAIGSFHAIRRGIVVSCSAGNDGPQNGTVSNVAPWIITVGASTTDRQFVNVVELGNGLKIKGESISGTLEGKFFPLISADMAKAKNASANDALLCKIDTLDPAKAKGKILACLRGETARVEKGYVAELAGAVGMILCNDESTGNDLIADPHFLPASSINYKNGLSVFSYINTTKNAIATIQPASKRDSIAKPAPSMAAFSSAGPNVITPAILKPDITAPGVNIIAAFSELASVSEFYFDTRRVPFNLESGTSMSCPHVAGVAGLLKTLHPDWSPAAIRSAIMTSARTRDNTVRPILDGFSHKGTPFNYGSGHLRPNRAMNPGLVYDLSVDDYLDFFCAIGYNQTLLENFFPGHKCSKSANLLNFNYPSISISRLCSRSKVTATRKLKNVGSPGKYAVRVTEPYGIAVSVEPSVLEFNKIGEEKSFKASFSAKWEGAAENYEFGMLTWTDGIHYVKSPIVVSS